MEPVLDDNPFKVYSMRNKRRQSGAGVEAASSRGQQEGDDVPLHDQGLSPIPAAAIPSSTDPQAAASPPSVGKVSSKAAKQGLRMSPRQARGAADPDALVPTVANPRAAVGRPQASVKPDVGMPEKLGQPVQPLRLIIIGHNPSEETWRRGHAYAHPSNHMWRLLIKTGIAPAGIRGADDDDKMPALAGVGFSDVGTGHPGTDSSAFKSSVFQGWSEDFYTRMRAHMVAASAAIGCTCGTCGAPALVAFSGKRHYVELLNIDKKGASKVKTVELGLQPPASAPPGWPFPSSTEIWVCCSTSGASPMTAAQREAPYQAVASRLAQIPWPRRELPRCKAG